MFKFRYQEKFAFNFSKLENETFFSIFASRKLCNLRNEASRVSPEKSANFPAIKSDFALEYFHLLTFVTVERRKRKLSSCSLQPSIS